jgi:hypothetical protein
LPARVESEIFPILKAALAKLKLEVPLSVAGEENEKLLVSYPALKMGTGYASSTIQLEFGARSTGEPNSVHTISCDIADEIPQIDFPTARPLVMAAERTFWEKATAAHVYCLQKRLRGERYSRHWYDLVQLARSNYFELAVNNRGLALSVAQHQSKFFSEKDLEGTKIDYGKAIEGNIQLVPSGESLIALERDYDAMLKDGLLSLHEPGFAELMEGCRDIETRINKLKL